jgi:hypothetical protein
VGLGRVGRKNPANSHPSYRAHQPMRFSSVGKRAVEMCATERSARRAGWA